MDQSTLLRRTPAGLAELSHPSHGLSLTQRRFLTLLDTSCRADELASRHRADPAKFDRDVARLTELGLVAGETAESPESANEPSVVGLGTSRTVRRWLLALLSLVAATLVGNAWHRGAHPRAPTAKVAPSAERTVPASTTATPRSPDVPAVIATRVLRGEPSERTRDAPGANAVAKTVDPKRVPARVPPPEVAATPAPAADAPSPSASR